jgi:HEPN domain-containing protein
MEALRQEVDAWLTKARHDLAAAHRLGEGDPPLLDTAVHHCQQTGEKALKALLAATGNPPRRTHDLRVLLDALLSEFPALESLRADTELFTPFATIYRHPGEFIEPEPDEFAEALASAQRALQGVERHLR